MNPHEWSAHDTLACAAWCDAHEDELMDREYSAMRLRLEADVRRANARADRARHALVLVAVCCLAAGVCVGVIAR